MSAPYPITLGGQSAWCHDEGCPSGLFHTYDALSVFADGDAPRKVHVFIPRDHGPPRGQGEGGGPYPVVYMNDGDTAFWGGGAGGKSWDVAKGLEELYAERVIPRVIVVAVVPRAREDEYTHVEGRPGGPGGGIDLYARTLADHIKPFIDAHYRTRPGAEHTAIVGASHGGLAAFLIACSRPDRFRNAGCLSPSFWVGLDAVHGGSYSGAALERSPLLERCAKTLESKGSRPRIWIDWGLARTGGFHNEVIEAAATARGREMAELLERKFGYVEGEGLFTFEDPAGEHDETAWASRFPAVMIGLFGQPGASRRPSYLQPRENPPSTEHAPGARVGRRDA